MDISLETLDSYDRPVKLIRVLCVREFLPWRNRQTPSDTVYSTQIRHKQPSYTNSFNILSLLNKSHIPSIWTYNTIFISISPTHSSFETVKGNYLLDANKESRLFVHWRKSRYSALHEGISFPKNSTQSSKFNQTIIATRSETVKLPRPSRAPDLPFYIFVVLREINRFGREAKTKKKNYFNAGKVA